MPLRVFLLRARSAVAAASMALLVACSPSSLVDVQSPSTVVDPSQVKTADAAMRFYQSAIAWFAYPLVGNSMTSNLIGVTGLFTDELAETNRTAAGIDERLVSLAQYVGGNPATLYQNLHQARIQAQQAREALQRYAPTQSKALQGELYALEAYTILFFAENFCSGIPLTAVPLVGTPTETAGLTTEQLFDHALVLFDSAIVAGADSASVVQLAKVGKGRALLGLGEFPEAMAAVQGVEQDFVYAVQISSGFNRNTMSAQVGNYRAQDGEGGNGLVWSADPRTALVIRSTVSGGMLWPAKYFVTGSGTLDPSVTAPYTPVRLADGLEAQLIIAEAQLAAHDPNWLVTLNNLRATCVEATPCAPVPGLDAAALPALADPGTDTARLSLVMKERAMWLYLTGHREADLRRQARIYQRNRTTLWPTGQISAPAFPPLYRVALAANGTSYGTDVVLPPSPKEQTDNPLYGGCYDQDP